MYLKFSSLLFTFYLIVTVSPSAEDQWKKFKLDYGKTYDDAEEKIAFRAFQANLLEIENHNKLYEKGTVSYIKGITKFADLTAKEFIQKYSLRQGSLLEYDYPFNVTSNSTQYLNWKERGAVTKVKDQGICGACWIYSAGIADTNICGGVVVYIKNCSNYTYEVVTIGKCKVGVVEGFYYRKHNKSITLSEQNLIDCINANTCQGGSPLYVLWYLKKKGNGINTEEDYPHKGMKNDCKYDKSKKVKLDNYNFTALSCNEEELKEILEENGPVGIGISANGDWRLYESGVWFENSCSDEANHAILLVGYGTENGHDYWLLKNSYGKEWGLNGYMKIARNVNKNFCGLQSFIMFINS